MSFRNLVFYASGTCIMILCNGSRLESTLFWSANMVESWGSFKTQKMTRVLPRMQAALIRGLKQSVDSHLLLLFSSIIGTGISCGEAPGI
jgi:hypothetical protein